MTCARQSTPGAAQRTDWHSRRMASQSWGVSVKQVPAPACTPLEELDPGSTWTKLTPSVAIVCRTALEVPRPTSITAMTAAMPMTIPRQVNTERIKWRRNARSAVREIR